MQPDVPHERHSGPCGEAARQLPRNRGEVAREGGGGGGSICSCDNGVDIEGGPSVEVARNAGTTKGFPLVLSSGLSSTPRHVAAYLAAVSVVPNLLARPVRGARVVWALVYLNGGLYCKARS